MQLMEIIKKTKFLGQEFLMWLWYKSETNDGVFDLGEAGEAKLWFDRRVVLQSEGDEGVEKVVCSGENPDLKEARFALTENKAITDAMVKLIIGDNEWSFNLDSTWMNFTSFKSPKVIQDKDEDPEGLFYEKYSLIQQAVSAIDCIFSSFIRIRISSVWEKQELPALLKWIRAGK